jgi:hypothetical protein
VPPVGGRRRVETSRNRRLRSVSLPASFRLILR